MSRGLSAVDFSKFFMLDLHSCTRGHSWKLKKSRCNTDLPQHFSERIITWWNKLDEDTVTATSTFAIFLYVNSKMRSAISF